MKRAWRSATCVAVYGGSAALILGTGGVLSDPAHYYVGAGYDPAATMWFLSWWPYAVAHHLNPFISKLVWAPAGVNLTWSTSIPALSALAFPLTHRFGPVVAYNCLAVLAPVLSALSAYWLCDYLFSSFWAAMVGGWIYGFSSYEAAEAMFGHLSLTVVFVPPLCAMIFLMRLRNEINAPGFVLALVAMFVLQFLISNEILATMTFFGLAAIVLAAAFANRALRRRLSIVTMESAIALLATGIIVSPYLYYMFHGDSPHGPLYPADHYSTDLLGFVLPNYSLSFLGIARGLRIGNLLFLKHFGETDAYISWPIILIVVLYAWRRLKTIEGKLILSMLGLICVASMGPRLHIMDRATVPLPWVVATRLPLLEHALPGRFVLFAFLLLALAVSAWLAADQVRTRLKIVLAVLLVVFSWPAISTSRMVSPDFFSSGLYARYLPRNALVMVVPFAETGPSMLWQAQSGMYFRMAGGWTGPPPREYKDWPVVKALLAPTVVPPARYQLEAFLGRYQVDAVVIADADRSGWRPVIAMLDPNPVHAGGVTVYKVPPRLFEIYRDATASQAERTALLALLREMLNAADRYVTGGGDWHTLNLARLRKQGLMPDRGEDAASARGRAVSEYLEVTALGDDSFVVHVYGLYPAIEAIDRSYGVYDRRTNAPSPQHIFHLNQDYGAVTLVLDRERLKRAAAAMTYNPKLDSPG